MNEKAKRLLIDELALLENAKDILLYSYKKCELIDDKKKLTQKETDAFELLASRFSRLSDIVIKKIFRLIERIDLEDKGTVRDAINLAEKKNLIADADSFIEIREVRNSFAHEYIQEVVSQIFVKVYSLTPVLLDSVKRIRDYCKNKYGV